ncbi:MAG: SBBP repeat-containing protein [Planctomycetota bacterium]
MLAYRFIVSVVALFFGIVSPCLADDFELAWSTYLGGSGKEDTARAVAVDNQGSIFVGGGTMSPDFPNTEGTHDRIYNGDGGSVGSLGPMDAFVTKLDPQGRIAWSTLLGGPNYDRIYTVRVDGEGFVYVAGRAGEGFPTTSETVQPEFLGHARQGGAYGKQNGFITKLRPDGSAIVWSTYFGTQGSSIVHDIDIDREGCVYLTMIEVDLECPHVTPGAFQSRKPGDRDSVVAKLSADGRRVLWCTYLGGTGRDLAPSLRVDAEGQPVVAGSTFSSDFPTTEGAFQPKPQGKEDAFVAKLAADGSRLIYSTLLGGSDADGAEGRHGLALDKLGRPCVAGFTSSADFPATPGAFQHKYAGGMTGDWRQTGDRFVAIFSADGSRLECATLLGGGARDGGEGIDVDEAGRIYLGGFTYSSDFPVTPSAIQSTFQGAARPHGPLWGGGDATAIVLSPDLSRAIFSTYLGGSGEDLFRACAVTSAGELVLVGSTTSTDWPTKDASQPSPRGGRDEVIVAKFRLVPRSSR